MMFDIVENNILMLNGVFNSKSNHKVVVRDHIFGRKSGFLELVFPELIRHPCNCQLILHADNSSKRSSNNQTLDKLFEKIISYDKCWFEQDMVLDKIERYNRGERWVRKFGLMD